MTMMMGGKVHRTRSKARRSAGGVPGAFLQGVDGTRIPLTPDDYRRVREFLLAEPERAVADDERITTGEAARILGVSQRTLTRMLDAGMIPYTRMGERSYRFLTTSAGATRPHPRRWMRCVPSPMRTARTTSTIRITCPGSISRVPL